MRDYADDIWMVRWVRGNSKIMLVSDNKFKSSSQNKSPKVIEPPQIYKCKQDGCEKVFFDSGSLKKHMSTHGERLFICPEKGCNKKFLDNSKLRRHQVVHTVHFTNPGRAPVQVRDLR